MDPDIVPLCGTPYHIATSGDDLLHFACDQDPGHEGAHFADVHGRNADGPRIAVLRWRT